jgi:hypothetical protein
MISITFIASEVNMLIVRTGSSISVKNIKFFSQQEATSQEATVFPPTRVIIRPSGLMKRRKSREIRSRLLLIEVSDLLD